MKKVSKDTSFHEHFRIQDIKYNRTGEDRGAAKSRTPSEQIFVQSEAHRRKWRKT